ncbi:TPA: hypothetical protein VD722_000386 [Streptococcus pyogenes]|nr:hypothetical protein [Streptococcus pyogenes]HEQ1577560.1 hypothetical protein [Streptococcus pyogenes]
MDWIQCLELFNALTGPIVFGITIWTFVLARATKNKLEETTEIALFYQDSDLYLGRLDAIKSMVDELENRQDLVPEKAVTQLMRLISEFENNYPALSSRKKVISSPVQRLKKLRTKQIITLLDFIDPFNAFYAVFSSRKELK